MNTIMKNKALLMSLLATALVPAAQAYEYHTFLGSKIKWIDHDITLHAGKGSFPVGDMRDDLTTAKNRWNDNPANFRYTLEFDDEHVGLNNFQNEIWMSTDQDILDGAPALTCWWHAGTALVEADIIADADFDFTTSSSTLTSSAYEGSSRTFISTCLHEMGHALGLAHENDLYNLMGQAWTHVNANNSTVHFYPGEDASNGAVFLYGLDSNHREDVSVTHWKRLGADGEYSTHTRTVIYDTAGNPLRVHSGTGDDPAYEVSLGQQVDLEFQFENNGATTQSPLTGYYLSTGNNNITTLDRLLATSTPTIGRNTTYKTTKRLTIPSDLSHGTTYWLGIIVDKDDTIEEVNETNNATYVGIYVR